MTPDRAIRACRTAIRWPLVLLFALAPALSLATPYTPPAWQVVVDAHADPALIGQRKHTTWSGDLNRNFIDDQIEQQFKPGDYVSVIVQLNRCLMPQEIERFAAGIGTVRHVGQLVTFVVLEQVPVDELARLAARPEVAMIEWRAPDVPEMDVATRAIQARRSAVYAGQAAEDLTFNGTVINGTGINIAVVDNGVDDGTGMYASLPLSKFVAGVDVTNATAPRDGSHNPTSAVSNHGSVMASIALGTRSPGRTCRTPTDDPQAVLECGGVAPGAGLVDVKMCAAAGCQAEAALDWVAAHAREFNIRVVLYAYSRCGDDNGNGALAQQANLLTALGLVFVTAHGNAPGVCMPANTIGQRLVKQPGSGSFVLTVAAGTTGTTINRNDDTTFANRFIGPRSDWNFATPNLMALKPDLAAPQFVTIHQAGTTMLTDIQGTSAATAVTAGAAALLLQRFPAMSPDSVKQALLRSADSQRNTAFSTMPGPWANWDSSLGWGLLNVGRAINTAIAAAPSPRFANCNTPSLTNPGELCTLRDGLPVWSNTTDIQATTMPKVGTKTTIRVHVQNDGSAAATFDVKFGVYVFSAGNHEFHHIGTKQVTLAAGANDWAEMDWTPAATDHQCIQVSIATGNDADYTDNFTQRNFQILPSQYVMRVENPLFKPARIDIVARSDRAGWQCMLSDTTFPLDPAGCARNVTITFDAPAGAKVGDYANCDVGVYATPVGEKERRLIGGVTARTFVPKSCRAWGQLVDARGGPIANASVRASRVHAPESVHYKAGPTVVSTATTNEDGIYEITVAQDARHLFVVEAPRGGGELVMRASCGFGIPRLILTEEGLSSEPVEPGTRERHAHGASHY